MAKQDKQKDLQQKYMELQVLDQQIRQIHQQMQAVEQQAAEIEFINMTLDELSKSKIDSETLVPLSSGIFVKAQLRDNKIVHVNVGGNTVVEKSIPDTKAMLDRQIIELRKMQEELTKQVAEANKKAEQKQLELQSLM